MLFLNAKSATTFTILARTKMLLFVSNFKISMICGLFHFLKISMRLVNDSDIVVVSRTKQNRNGTTLLSPITNGYFRL